MCSASRRSILFASLACAGLCSAIDPELLWSRLLPDSGTIEGQGLRKGNGVVLSDDQQSLWVTTETGSLHVYSKDGQDKISTFQPTNIANRYTESRSSVSLYQPHPNKPAEYAVYAVIDVPHGGQGGSSISRFVLS